MHAVAASARRPAGSPAAIERRRQQMLAALGLPALALLAVLFAYPVLRLMALSVEGGTLAWYAKALGESLGQQRARVSGEPRQRPHEQVGCNKHPG